MDGEQEQRLDELFFRDSQWIAENGRYIHENNVLFYFAQSPFFDRQSNNNSVFQQAVSDARFGSWLATRENFEAQLRRIAGTEYVVIHDPIASKTRYENGDLSNVWVVQKQARRKRIGEEDEVTPIAIYYIVGEAIYQAPNIAKLIGNRMLSTATSLNKMLSIAAPLPFFSAAHGHTYLVSASKSSQPKQTSSSQPSKEDTQMRDNDVSAPTQPNNPQTSTSSSSTDTQLFLDALTLSRLHSKSYMDTSPLAGEPGNFRTSKPKDAPTTLTTTNNKENPNNLPAKEKSPPAVAASPPPPIQTDIPSVGGGKKSASRDKGGDKSPTTPGTAGVREKPKRRKSRPVATPTATEA